MRRLGVPLSTVLIGLVFIINSVNKDKHRDGRVKPFLESSRVRVISQRVRVESSRVTDVSESSRVESPMFSSRVESSQNIFAKFSFSVAMY